VTASRPTLVEALARRVASLRAGSLPAEVVRMATRCVLDTLGCALHGATTSEAARLAAAADELGGSGRCTVWGTARTAPPPVAALLNGTHAHLRELDDIGGGGHASACQLPAALAAAELVGASGSELLLGLVAGHEVSSRLTDAASYDTMTLRGWHTTGLYGSLGATAAAARVLGLDAEATADALGLCASYTGGLWAFMADGAMSKRVHPGKSAETAIVAAVLARQGVSGPRHALEAAWGGLFPTCAPGEADAGRILAQLDDGFRILRKGFKTYPVCWGIASAADGLLALRGRHGLAGADVAHVRVTLSEMSRRMVGGRRIASVLDAQMSLPWSLACLVVRGRLTLDEFGDEALGDPALHAAMDRVALVVDPRAHGERQTVEIETRDGRRLRERVETPRGHWDQPLGDDALQAKFVALAGAALGPAEATEVADLVWALDSTATVKPLLDRLQRPATAQP
jgi:2-methylcitrate dehydratase PrpD